jgi:hypothetical protein
MPALRVLARVFGWLLTPFVAWAASFLGAVVTARIAGLIPSPRAGLYLTAIGAFIAGLVAIWGWLRLLRRSPELRERLHVTAEGSPAAAEETIAATADNGGNGDDTP